MCSSRHNRGTEHHEQLDCVCQSGHGREQPGRQLAFTVERREDLPLKQKRFQNQEYKKKRKKKLLEVSQLLLPIMCVTQRVDCML